MYGKEGQANAIESWETDGGSNAPQLELPEPSRRLCHGVARQTGRLEPRGKLALTEPRRLQCGKH